MGQSQRMVATACYSRDPVHLEGSNSLWLIDTLEVTMTQLSSVLLNRGAAPRIEISILIDCSEVMLTCIYLNRLDTSKRR